MRIISEIGVNHGGILPEAMLLALKAKEAGADAVKFQTWFHPKWDVLNKLRFSKDEWKVLFDYCDDRKIPWFSTPFDLEAIEFLKGIGMKTWKVPSGMVTNRTFLEAIRVAAYSQGKEAEIILSSGCCDMGEVFDARRVFPWIGDSRTPQITPIHCVSLYPAELHEMNMGIFQVYPGFFRGLSDHTTGYEAAVMATVLRLDYFEKHITLDTRQEGPDHASSLNPWEFSCLVDLVKRIKEGMGNDKPGKRERETRDPIRNRMAMAC
jgi:N,N'-diacetyllegionaminate synthase